MKWVFGVLFGVGCMQVPVDPMADARRVQKVTEKLPLPTDWQAQAMLLLSEQAVADLIKPAIEEALRGGLKQTQMRVMGADLTLMPELNLTSFSLTGSLVCESCLSADLAVSGVEHITLRNPTGTWKESIAWTASVATVFDVAVTENKQGKRQITMGLAGAEAWQVEVEVSGLPQVWKGLLGETLTKEARKLVSKPELPRIPIARLGGELPVPLMGVRIGKAPSAIAIELGFQATGMGVVEAVPEVKAGWALVVPSETVLGLMKVTALRQGPGSEPVVPEMVALSLSDNRFTLDIAAWSKTKNPKAKRFRVSGSFGLGQDERLHIEADHAELIHGKGAGIDLATLLFKKRILTEITETLAGTVPAKIESVVKEKTVAVVIEQVSAEEDVLLMRGRMGWE